MHRAKRNTVIFCLYYLLCFDKIHICLNYLFIERFHDSMAYMCIFLKFKKYIKCRQENVTDGVLCMDMCHINFSLPKYR